MVCEESLPVFIVVSAKESIPNNPPPVILQMFHPNNKLKEKNLHVWFPYMYINFSKRADTSLSVPKWITNLKRSLGIALFNI